MENIRKNILTFLLNVRYLWLTLAMFDGGGLKSRVEAEICEGRMSVRTSFSRGSDKHTIDVCGRQRPVPGVGWFQSEAAKTSEDKTDVGGPKPEVRKTESGRLMTTKRK